MSAIATVRSNKTTILEVLSADPTLILTKVHEKELITDRENRNLRSSNRVNVEEQMIELMDKMINKGEDTCQDFLNLLQTDEDIRSTYPKLQNIHHNKPLPKPVQACSDYDAPSHKRLKQDEQYPLNSQPVGLCLIMNNENFSDGSVRRGSSKDACDLSEVFSWLGFRVLVCRDQTADQMERALKCFASLSSVSQLQEFGLKEWTNNGFTELQHPPPEHGDAFICCILSDGTKGVILGIDRKPLCIQQIPKTFKATDQSALTGKPKVFLIQACQGPDIQKGVTSSDLEADDSSLSIPVEADCLVQISTVEDYKCVINVDDGSWFVQSVCKQLKEGCPRGDDILTILCRVNDEVSKKEGSSSQIGKEKQMSVISRVTLRKTLVLSPHTQLTHQ
ncbi:caspase-3-like [Betta splendens]|uniref:Caspase-3-like n=1 Tax=Betta splendens TaxID=158456 RepID=A0A9W2XD40_BETSP|nr:caspase-3-like [Betta splendens]XP_055359638.1 caspase-3-like [Betta splendens]